jgi:transcriptional regulator with XRE-family HTH domain
MLHFALTMGDVSALQHFFDAERQRRGWSVREAAKRSQISLSKAYAIVNGDDNVEFETFENIATAFNMTPAELATAIGKGAPQDDPAHALGAALFRAVPIERQPAAIDMLRGLQVQPTRTPRKSLVDGAGKRREASRRELLTGSDPSIENEPKRRKGLVTQPSGSHFRDLVQSALASVGLNRDFRPVATPA